MIIPRISDSLKKMLAKVYSIFKVVSDKIKSIIYIVDYI